MPQQDVHLFPITAGDRVVSNAVAVSSASVPSSSTRSREDSRTNEADDGASTCDGGLAPSTASVSWAGDSVSMELVGVAAVSSWELMD